MTARGSFVSNLDCSVHIMNASPDLGAHPVNHQEPARQDDATPQRNSLSGFQTIAVL
jgi:hypothetical protein